MNDDNKQKCFHIVGRLQGYAAALEVCSNPHMETLICGLKGCALELYNVVRADNDNYMDGEPEEARGVARLRRKSPED